MALTLNQQSNATGFPKPAIVRVPVKFIHDYPVLRLKAAGAGDLYEFRGFWGSCGWLAKWLG